MHVVVSRSKSMVAIWLAALGACTGYSAGRPPVVAPTPAVTAAKPVPPAQTTAMRQRRAGHDVNGDGFADVVAGTQLMLGARDGLSATRVIPLAPPGPPRPILFMGAALAGDVDGDGFADVLIGDPACPPFATDKPLCGVGHIHLYRGSRTGLASQPTISLEAPGGENTDFGMLMSAAGDLNGDGFSDVVVHESTVVDHVYYGGSAGLLPSAHAVLQADASNTVRSPASPAGDVDRDGYDDVVVTAAGRVLVFHGSPHGLETTARSAFEPSGVQAWTGLATTAGDFNADGFSDIAIGVPESGPSKDGAPGPGRVVVHHGGPRGISAVPAGILESHEPPRAGFGVFLASVGDLDDDGSDDLVVVAPCAIFDASKSSCEMGRAYLYLGGPKGLGSTPVAQVSPVRKSFWIGGNALIPAGDVDADGHSDFMFGAYLFRGASGGVISLDPPSL